MSKPLPELLKERHEARAKATAYTESVASLPWDFNPEPDSEGSYYFGPAGGKLPEGHYPAYVGDADDPTVAKHIVTEHNTGEQVDAALRLALPALKEAAAAMHWLAMHLPIDSVAYGKAHDWLSDHQALLSDFGVKP